MATALLAGVTAAPVGANASVSSANALDYIDVTFKLAGKRAGGLSLRLTRGRSTYASGSIARARPGSNRVRLFADRIMTPGKYTLRWIFRPASGAKRTSGANIVTVRGPR